MKNTKSTQKKELLDFPAKGWTSLAIRLIFLLPVVATVLAWG